MIDCTERRKGQEYGNGDPAMIGCTERSAGQESMAREIEQ
ncbi:MAG: hypothetical protein QOC94_3177 [Actinoplanes sp.]|nr:hypothetical protein [Actinoplanes sp.]